MKYKAVIEGKIDDSKIMIESLIKGLDNNSISKPEMRIKLVSILSTMEALGNAVAIEHNDF